MNKITKRQWILLLLAVVLAGIIFRDWDNFKRGLMGLPEKQTTVQAEK